MTDYNANNKNDKKSFIEQILGNPIEVPELDTYQKYLTFVFGKGFSKFVSLIFDSVILYKLVEYMDSYEFHYTGDATRFLLYLALIVLNVLWAIDVIRILRNLVIPAGMKYISSRNKKTNDSL